MIYAEIKKFCIHADSSIRQTMQHIDTVARGIALITEEHGQKLILKGTVTDGDIRRWILGSGDLDASISQVMNPNPIFVSLAEKQKASDIMKKSRIEVLPVLDNEHNLIDILFWDEHFENKPWTGGSLNSPVVIMAGGKGTRLYPFTHVLPKPLVPVVEIPIAERIIYTYYQYGCREFYMTVNHKKEMIQAYFDSIEKDYSITYIEEPKPLGTAGSLALLKGKITQPFFINNCDILIEADYATIMKQHQENNYNLSLVTCMRTETIPYGIINLDSKGKVGGVTEKPQHDFLVNTGMYIMNPECLDDIPENKFFHITDLMDQYNKEGIEIGTYPVSTNSWLDMGSHEEYKRMEEYFRKEKI